MSNRNKEYYKQFNTREEEITKDNRGVAVRQNEEQHEEDWDREVSGDEMETNQQQRKEELAQKTLPGVNMDQEIIINLAAKLKYYSDHDWEFRRIIQELVNGPERKELEIKNTEEAGKVKKEIIQRKKELQLEKEVRKQRIKVSETKKDFWQGKGLRKGVTYDEDQPGPSQRH